ncbi:hypothetical protein [uncultured Gordonia sp.]|uniref:hypothetical protein n=1 Tax=uncultured Gordonia sp. TaxID=198437 RepID=UPI00258C2C1C|nr:hypothetical protein [uncultured Gordonia sp.]
MSNPTAPSPVHITNRRLEGLSTDLLVQVPCTSSETTRSLIRDLGVGVVYTIDYPQRRKRIAAAGYAIDHTRREIAAADILVDAALYSGSQRITASAPLSADWVRFQHQKGNHWALTDSGYCAEGDRDGLRKLLAAAGALGSRVIAALPIAGAWLAKDATYLRERIDAAGVPVALIVEDAADPFDQPGMVAGLVEVLRAQTPVLLLRSDTAALGALAHGAAGAAMGSSSAYRHLYPNLGGGGTAPTSFIVPELLGYISQIAFDNARRQAHELDAWICECSRCHGADLKWINGDRDAAFGHSICAAAMLGEQLAPTERDAAALLWTSMCQTAQAKHHEVLEATGDWKGLKPSLQQWVDITPKPQAIS